MPQKTGVQALLMPAMLLIFSQFAAGQTATRRENLEPGALPVAVSGHEERLGAAIR